MENFKEGYYWCNYKSMEFIEWIFPINQPSGYEFILYLGKDLNEFYELFKIKA